MVSNISYSLYALQQVSLIKKANITHVISVMSPQMYTHDMGLFQNFTHLAINVEDDPNEDLLKYFPITNKFILDGLEMGGGVFVHW
jgi:hypothetical protein